MLDARLVTVTGPPGAGKTRLAQEVAARTVDLFEGGTWFVELASLADPGLVLSAIAEAAGVLSATAGTPMDALVSHFGSRNTLLVLDNFEHLTPAATDVAALVLRAPAVHLLVTSRTPLHLSAEHEYALNPLQLPAPDMSPAEVAGTEAVELFGRRALASEPTFAVGDENASDVAELCRRLDGLPLALELAAARVKLLPLAGILARVDHRLALLSDGPRDLPVRHRSLRAAVAWSYDLLDPSEQRLFRRLSVFRGGWTIEDAAVVDGLPVPDSDAVLSILGALVDSSLVVRERSDDREPRFTMLETLREFAAERLEEAGEVDLTRRRHAVSCVELAERMAPAFTGVDPGSALDRIGRDHDNMRAALAYGLDHEPSVALRIGSALWRFWQMRGYLIEGERWIGAALQAAATPPADPGLESGDIDTHRADALSALGSLAYWRGDVPAARPYYEEALELRRHLGDERKTADALYDLAFMFAPYFFPPPENPERTEQAVRLVREAAELYGRRGDEPGLAKTGWMLGNLTIYRSLEEAERLLRASVAQFRRLRDPFGLGWALRMHGCALLGVSDTSGAGDSFREALSLFATAGDGSAMGMLLGDLGDLAQLEGDGLRAARLKGASAGLRQITEAGLANVLDVPWLVHVHPLDELGNEADLERALAEGRGMSQADAISYALGAPGGELSTGLRVTALGAFGVERSGVRLEHWGGAKAGSRQAQAMFGFLLDRGERGVTKDELIEVIWPDSEVTQGDLSFHRTLGGLRGTLQPDRNSGPSPVVFVNGRYRLQPGLIGWEDVAEFERHLQQAAQATDELAAIRGLQEARALYRGDYLDDCPFYGDSEYVEEHRTRLRGRLIDAMVDLGRRYERRGDASRAAASFREALALTGGDCPAAMDGLARLGMGIT